MTNENQSHNINDNKLLLKSSYYYDLPEELIAQTPVEPRDSSRLLVYDKTNNKIEHKIFHDIVEYLKAGDILVINNTEKYVNRLRILLTWMSIMRRVRKSFCI